MSVLLSYQVIIVKIISFLIYTLGPVVRKELSEGFSLAEASSLIPMPRSVIYSVSDSDSSEEAGSEPRRDEDLDMDESEDQHNSEPNFIYNDSESESDVKKIFDSVHKLLCLV